MAKNICGACSSPTPCSTAICCMTRSYFCVRAFADVGETGGESPLASSDDSRGESKRSRERARIATAAGVFVLCRVTQLQLRVADTTGAVRGRAQLAGVTVTVTAPSAAAVNLSSAAAGMVRSGGGHARPARQRSTVQSIAAQRRTAQYSAAPTRPDSQPRAVAGRVSRK
eukprot:6175719-Pleurochrysis_carterae.AAC.4